VALGLTHACARNGDGTISCWGSNDHGQLGDGSAESHAMPVSVPGITGATQIASGSAHVCARTSDGLVRCWGNNAHGQLGNESRSDCAAPASVSVFGDTAPCPKEPARRP
jgi:alpha-tubulin suppressor-like RCC1 family protein